MTVTVLTGFWTTATDAVADRLLRTDPQLTALRYEADAGTVRRRLCTRTSAGAALPVSNPAGDAADAVRRDLAATLDPAHDTVVVLPDVTEPDAVTVDVGRPVSVITVVAAEHLLDALASADGLRQLGIQESAGDHRTLSDVVARQIEQADTVVMWGRPCDGDDWETDQLATLLHRLAPWARHLRLDPHDPDEAVQVAARTTVRPAMQSRSLLGYPIGVHEPLADNGVVSAVFRARRPFHPTRLQDALDDVTDGVLRSRGVFWVASRPDLVLAWESAGELSLGPLGTWLADVPDNAWADVDDSRRLAAAVEWDPYYDDRHSHLVFIGFDLDPVQLHRRLVGCLLTDTELADGPDVWRAYQDPFTRCYHVAGPQAAR